jgi:hypothetical protein
VSTEASETHKNELAELLDFHGVVHAGDVLVVECERRLTPDEFRSVGEMAEHVLTKFGVGMILLAHGMRVAGKKAP